MPAPIEVMFNDVEWRDCPPPAETDGMPYPVREGVLDMFGFPMRCYVLNTGQRIFAAEDVARFFGATIDEDGRMR
jgi:hypothetical protein